MSDREQVQHFESELNKLVDRFRAEYEISYAAIVGTLQIKAHMLCAEAANSEEGE